MDANFSAFTNYWQTVLSKSFVLLKIVSFFYISSIKNLQYKILTTPLTKYSTILQIQYYEEQDKLLVANVHDDLKDSVRAKTVLYLENITELFCVANFEHHQHIFLHSLEGQSHPRIIHCTLMFHISTFRKELDGQSKPLS